MPLTRKQAWRRVRVRHELGDFKDEAAAQGNRVSRGVAPLLPWRPPAPLWYRRTPTRPPACPVRDERPSAVQEAALGNLRAPNRERDPSARLGASAARRLAGASCVRVGSRVSFNTVVAAVLIPSAKDLHDTARQDLWWQETDYRDFRINFIQYMRSSPTLADDSEMVPVDIVEEPSGASMAEEKQKESDGDDLQSVVMGTVEYANAMPDSREEVKEPCVRAWAVDRTEEGVEDDGTGEGWTDGGTNQARLSAAAPAADNVTSSSGSAAAESAITDDADYEGNASDSMSPISEAEDPVVTSTVPEDGATADMDGSSSSLLSSSVPPLCDPDKSAVVDEDDHEDDTTDEGTCWEDQQERSARSGPCLSWDSTECEDDRDRDIVRVGRSLTDLDTVRRSTGPRLHGGISGSFAAAAAVAAVTTLGGKGCDQGRPRALSLDGWFTCGLQYGIEIKSSSETHDHAGPLRDLVKLPPVPTICATSSVMKENEELDLTAALQRFRLAVKPGMDSSGGEDGETRGGASTIANGM